MNAVPTASEAVVLVVGDDTAERDRLCRELADVLGASAEVRAASGPTDAVAEAETVSARGGIVPVTFVDLGITPEDGGVAAVTLRGAPALASTRIVLITNSASLHGVDRALRSGALHGMVTTPWSRTALTEMLAAQLATHLVEHAPEHLGRFGHLLTDEDRHRAEQRIHQRRDAPERGTDQQHPLLDDATDDATVEADLVAALDRALGHPPRIRIGPGTTMIKSGDDVGGIYVVLDGVVRLTSTTDDGEVILHEQSTGAIVGLLSLASHRRALLTCRAVSEVRAIPITLEQLARAMDIEPSVGVLLNRVLITSLARRLRRSDILQAELDRSLAALSEARAQLVASARFATLGELSAGMAHELNNPAAALQRSIDHLGDDIAALLDADTSTALRTRLDREEPDLSSAERRALRRQLTARHGSRFADRLVSIGARDEREADDLAALAVDELDRLEAVQRLASTLRTAERAAHRMQSLVDSLRSYARGDDGRGAIVDDVDVERTIDSAVRLVAHRVGDASIERHPADALPLIVARPGALQHVWTNLVGNALDATGSEGTVTIRTSLGGHDTVVVEVEDDGPGIDPAVVERVFEPRFTTKQGRVSFGLGLGLSIARQIVSDHDGAIDVASAPGRTVFSVTLPVAGPANPDAAPAALAGAAGATTVKETKHG